MHDQHQQGDDGPAQRDGRDEGDHERRRHPGPVRVEGEVGVDEGGGDRGDDQTDHRERPPDQREGRPIPRLARRLATADAPALDPARERLGRRVEQNRGEADEQREHESAAGDPGDVETGERTGHRREGREHARLLGPVDERRDRRGARRADADRQLLRGDAAGIHEAHRAAEDGHRAHDGDGGRGRFGPVGAEDRPAGGARAGDRRGVAGDRDVELAGADPAQIAQVTELRQADREHAVGQGQSLAVRWRLGELAREQRDERRAGLGGAVDGEARDQRIGRAVAIGEREWALVGDDRFERLVRGDGRRRGRECERDDEGGQGGAAKKHGHSGRKGVGS